VVASPKLKPEELANTEQLIRRAFNAFRDDLNEALLQYMKASDSSIICSLFFICFLLDVSSDDIPPGTDILVRRSPQIGGKAKRIPKPDSYEELLSVGGLVLGIKAVSD
jgi:hypothetical protein